ncbi:MAG TPA: hypothetical protein VGN57_01285 [Pirellulaceae bacterium]|jgi:hypothetical protein|nr:hypothetical protein [Pirellulaceae bacterium]
MKIRSLCGASLFAAALPLLFAGCPTESNAPVANSASDVDGGETVRPVEPAPVAKAAPQDDAEAIAALKAAGVGLATDSAGNVVKANFDSLIVQDEAEVAAVLAKLSGLPNLREMIMTGPRFGDQSVEHLVGLEELRVVMMEDSGLSDKGAIQLAALPKLEALGLRRTNVTDESFRAFAKSKTLKRILPLRTNVTDAGIAALAELKTLEALDLTDCTKVSDEGIAALAGLEKMRLIKLWGSQISSESIKSIAGWKNLKVLGADDTKVDDDAAEYMTGFPELEELYAFRSKVGDACVKALAENSKKLRRVRLRDSMVTDAGLSPLAALPNLQVLDLSECYFDDPTVAAENIAKIESLQDLNLWYTRMGDPAAEKLASLKNLRSLNLDDNELTDASAPFIAQHEGLTYLHLGSNRTLSDAVVPELSKLKNLEDLVITFTQISQDGKAKLAEALPKTTITGP